MSLEIARRSKLLVEYTSVQLQKVCEIKSWQRLSILGLVTTLTLFNLLAPLMLIEKSIPLPEHAFTNSILTSEARASDLWQAWSTNATGCYFVENVCHSALRWFYKPDDPTTTTVHRSKQQQLPRVVVELNDDAHRKPYTRAGYPSRMVIDHLLDPTVFTQLRCQDSIIPHHLILFSVFNDMLGEFYDRSLMYIWSTMSWLFEQGNITTTSAEESFDSFLQYQQLYLHLSNPTKGLMGSHHLFSGLFRAHPLSDLTQLLQDSSCRCLPRLALCGYTRVKEPADLPVAARREHHETITLLAADFPVLTSTVYQAPIRNMLRQRLITQNPFVQQDIDEYRKSVLAGHVKRDDKLLDDWKIVGLAQRGSRRRWQNFNSVMFHTQQSLLNDRIVFVEINLDEPVWNPHTQLVRHGALDALVGIHGAQLTEAILMKPGALVVELLPYVPDGAWGEWVRTTNHPTPLGKIFTKTDLQHVGVPLTVDSVPYCFFTNVTGCWGTRHEIGWDNRDFQINSQVIIDIIRKMMVLPAKQEMTCEDYVREANHEMVLYNINCKETKNGQISAHQYYWKDVKPSKSAR